MASIDSANINDINLNTNRALPFGADYLAVTSYSGDNPTQIKYYKGGDMGKLIVTVDITYDGSGNVLTYRETR